MARSSTAREAPARKTSSPTSEPSPYQENRDREKVDDEDNDGAVREEKDDSKAEEESEDDKGGVGVYFVSLTSTTSSVGSRAMADSCNSASSNTQIVWTVSYMP